MNQQIIICINNNDYSSQVPYIKHRALNVKSICILHVISVRIISETEHRLEWLEGDFKSRNKNFKTVMISKFVLFICNLFLRNDRRLRIGYDIYVHF